MFIDVHCHIDKIEEIEADSVIANARKRKVIIVTDGTDVGTNRKVLDYANKYDNVRACLGIYPIEALEMTDKEIDKEIDFIEKNRKFVSGIGEVGMDFKEFEERERQGKIFEKFVKLSMKLNVPIVVHSRKAELECIEILEKLKAKKVVMHYFSGKLKLVSRIANNKWMLSIPTAVKNSEHFQNVIKSADISSLLCETDSPWSHPDRKFPNEPANVIESYRIIAKIKGLKLRDVEKRIEENFSRIFGKLNQK